MIDLLCCFRKHVHPIRINAEFAKDLEWWFQFFARWNGVSIFLVPGLEPPSDVEVTSDAAGAVGYGAYWRNEWFNGKWPADQNQRSIAFKELFPVVLATHIYGDISGRVTVFYFALITKRLCQF